MRERGKRSQTSATFEHKSKAVLPRTAPVGALTYPSRSRGPILLCAPGSGINTRCPSGGIGRRSGLRPATWALAEKSSRWSPSNSVKAL